MKKEIKTTLIVITAFALLFATFFYRTRLYRVDWAEEKKQKDTYIEEENIKEEKKELYKEELSSVKELPGQIIKCGYERKDIPAPKGISFTPDGKEFWITSLMNTKRGVVVFDSQEGEHLKDIVLPGGGGVEVIFNKDGSMAYVSQMETARVYEIDTELKEINRTLETESSWTKVMAISSDDKTLYVSNWSGNNISVFDLETGELSRNIQTVSTPRGIYPSENGKYLYVAGFKNGEIQKINLLTDEKNILYRSEGAMRHIVSDGKYLYVSDMARALIYRVNKENDEVEEFMKTETNPNTITLTEDKKILIVSNRGINNPQSYHIPGPEWGTVLFFDVSTGKMLDVLIGGNQPTGLDVYGNKIIYSNFLDGNIVLCYIPTYEEFLEKEEVSNFRNYIKK